jgi:hypothetical protein
MEMFLPMLKGQRKMRTKANWNLFVRLCGAKRRIKAANINQVNNIRLERDPKLVLLRLGAQSLICFLAIIVGAKNLKRKA